MAKETGPRETLQSLGTDIREAYARNKRVMSFDEYFALFQEKPRHQARSAAQYVKDAFEHYGTDEVTYPRGKVTRWRLFDCPWDDGRDRLIGQEDVQNRVYRTLVNFTRVGRVNKLILLHGPNGSAKSTFASCVSRGLENYSTTPEGALYRFNWMFPTQKVSTGGIGFGGMAGSAAGAAIGYDGGPQDTFAYLTDEQLDAKLRDELRDHPLLLLPAPRRRTILRELLGDDDKFVVSDYLLHGELGPRNRQIYEALLARYHGDFLKVLRHVQVERFFIKRRYREGSVTIEPQLHVDARSRQISIDKSMQSLPAVLQSVSLYEYSGELVEANRGLLEYADLLKRPMEAYKYLLGTVEHASVAVENAILHVDMVFIGSSNEEHLTGIKETPEWLSFRGRFELVRVPMLLDYTREAQIYAQKLRPEGLGKEIAPHATFVAALWAVLTRMRKPMPEKYGKELGELVNRLSPLEKAQLYALGKAPQGFTGDQAKDLVQSIEKVWSESEAYPNYEGRTGASPREIHTLLLNAAANARYPALTPLAVFEELEQLVKNVTVYHFLKQEPLPGGYHENDKFIGVVRGVWLDLVDDEVRNSMGLVDEAEYRRYFERYVIHVTSWVSKEKIRNPATGADESPDEEMMSGVEKLLGVGAKKDDFRRDVLSRVGAWSVDHPRERPDYPRIFYKEFEKVRESYFQEQRKLVEKTVRDLMVVLTDGAQHVRNAEDRARAEKTLAQMYARFGYSPPTAKEALSYLLKSRYS